jgi:hypothetical protein
VSKEFYEVTNGDLPAFGQVDGIGGLTKREYFAAVAMQGFIAMHAGTDCATPGYQNAAQASVLFADALLLQLEKRNERE